MGKYVVDTSEFPLVRCSAEGEFTNDELEAFIAETARVFERKEKFAITFDTSGMGTASAYMRSRSAEWQRAHAAELKAYCVGTAYVIKSPLMRFVAMTVLMVTRLPTPLRVCESEQDAIAWARARLAGD